MIETTISFRQAEKEMKNKLSQQIVEKYNLYKSAIIDYIEEFTYRKKRYYGVDFTVSPFLSDQKLDIDFIERSIRDSDKALMLDENMVGVIFDFANVESGLKETENLMTMLEPKLFNAKFL